MQGSGRRLSGRQINGVVGLVALVVVGVLLFFGLQLHNTQATARERAVTRFGDRAELISALTQAIFSAAQASPQTVRQYGAPLVSNHTLDLAARRGGLIYSALTDSRGRVIAASGAVTPAVRAGLAGPASPLRSALRGAPVTVSDVLTRDGRKIIEYAVPVSTPAGERVLVSGAPLALFNSFLSVYLQRVPARSGVAWVLDSSGNVVGARDPRIVGGRPVADPGLLAAVRHRSHGNYGAAGFFASVPVPQSSWRVVLTEPASALFYSVTGSRKWTPWVLLITLGLVAIGFLIVLRRLLINATELADANRRLLSNNAKLQGTNALLRHAAELARSNAELEQFASIASHDLQEPLRKVQTFASQLASMEADRLSEDGQDYLRRMSNAASRMRRLIDDLLMFSRVSTKGRPFVEVDLAEVVEQVLIDLEAIVEETGAQVTVDDLPVIAADPTQMRQLVQNLLGNALKFRREGAVPVIRLDAHVVDGVVELVVQDNGIGFDPQFATRIFGAFERLHGVTDFPGTGIGLALCRKIVERHHGTITADSAIGMGSVFAVRLPVEQPGPSADADFDALAADLMSDEQTPLHV